MNKNNVNTNETAEARPATTLEVLDKVSEATSGLRSLPTILQLLIDNFNLDALDMPEDDQLRLGHSYKMVYDCIILVQEELIKSNEEIMEILTK